MFFKSKIYSTCLFIFIMINVDFILFFYIIIKNES